MHHLAFRVDACCLRGSVWAWRGAGWLHDRNTRLAWGYIVPVAAGARMWHLIWLHRVAVWLLLVHDSGGAGVRDAEGRGVGCFSPGGWRGAVAARARAVRGDAGGLAAPAGGAAADGASGRGPGPAGPPVP